MPRAKRGKTSEIFTRCFSFRCLGPISEVERVNDQYRLAHRFRNQLVEIEHRMWSRFRDAELDHPVVGPVLRHAESCEAVVDDAYDELRGAKSGGGEPTEEMRDRLASCKELRSVAWKDLKTIKRDNVEDLRPLYEHARNLAHGELLMARADFSAQGLRHGAYIRIEDAVKTASKSGLPSFEPYDGEGSIGTQLLQQRQRGEDDPACASLGLTARELLMAGDTRLRLGPPGAMDAHPRSELAGITWDQVPQLSRNLRRHAARTWVDLRIGTVEGSRAPIWARFPIVLHRPLPTDAVIKWAYVVRKRVGRRFEWRFQLTLESKAFDPCKEPGGTGACAIDLGWRRLWNDRGEMIGLRAGMVVDEIGVEREIQVPTPAPANLPSTAVMERLIARGGRMPMRDGRTLMGAIAKVDDLAKIRREAHEHAIARLDDWIAGHAAPDWLREALSRGRWSERRLAGLVDHWGRERFDGDEHVLFDLRAWAHQDRHLYHWQAHQREKIIAARRARWRQIAAELTSRYATIVIEDGRNRSPDRPSGSWKLPDLGAPGWERHDPEDGDPSEGRDQRRMSRIAAVGELRAEILKAAKQRGCRVVVEAIANTTRECAWCSHVQQDVDFRAVVTYRCEDCGRVADQDANAGRNLLHRNGFSSGPVPPANPGSARGPQRRDIMHGSGGAAHAAAARAR